MSFLTSFILFVLVALLFFTVPGVYLLTLSRHKFAPAEKIFLGTIVGFIISTLIFYIFLVLNLTIIALTLLLVTDLLAIRSAVATFKNVKILSKKETLIIFIVFSVGIMGQMAIIAPSGTIDNRDILFWSSHGHDGSWHIALMEEIKKGWPFQNPVFAGEKLFNYHFFSDIAPAIFSKYFGFSNLDLYFRFFPLLFSLLLGTSAFFLGKKLGGTFSAGVWSTFFTYFAGSFGYIITYLKNGSIGGESIFWATQIQSSSGNPPQIISNFMFLAFFYLLYFLISKHDKFIFIIATLILGSLAVFKVYAAIILFAAVGIAGIWQLVKQKSFYLLGLMTFSGFLATALYLPNSSGSTKYLIFEPWWYIRTMIVEPSRLNWLDLELRRQTYLYFRNWKWVITLETLGFLIFFFGNLGMRLIGLLHFGKFVKKSLKNNFKLIFVTSTFISLILPLLFLQKGVATNTSQFLQYLILLFGILAGISTARIIRLVKPGLLKILIALVIIVLSIPTQIGLLTEFYSRTAYAKISGEEVEALNYLKNEPEKNLVILTPPYNQYLNLEGQVPNIWDWADTSYVSAFSGKRTYLDDAEQVDIMGYDFKERLEIKRAIFNETDPEKVKENIIKTKTDRIYFPKVTPPKVNLKDLGLKILFENQGFEIWKI